MIRAYLSQFSSVGGATGCSSFCLNAQRFVGFPLRRERRDALSEQLGAEFVFGVWRRIDCLVGTRQGHHSNKTTQAIHSIRLHRQFRRARPDHAVLHRQRVKVLQGAELIAARSTRDRESRGQLVAPLLGQPPPDGGISERFELRRRPAHVGRAAKYNGVAGVERGDDVVVFVTTFDDVLPIDRDQIGFCSVDGRCAFRNGFSYFFCVAELLK
jgi:hypothetical protein